MVALLLGYSVKKANKIHSPETSFGGFTSISEVAQELCRILNIFCEPITGSLKTLEKVTESLIFNDDVKNPQSISTILTPKVKVLLVCLLYRTNLKGFFQHLGVMNKIWLNHNKPVAISTTGVEQFFSEFERATSRMQMQTQITDEYGKLLILLFHFRRLSLERVAHDKDERRPCNTQHNDILESSIDLWELIRTNHDYFKMVWKDICKNQSEKMKEDASKVI